MLFRSSLIGLSIDSNPSHLAWLNSIQQLTDLIIPFPVIADRDGSVARLYGMISPEVSTQETVRNVYIIDPDQKIRCILTYPLTLGRNISEIIRIVEALQVADQFNVVTPANWQPGYEVLVPAAKTFKELELREKDPFSLGLECIDWYLCFKSLDLPTEEM